MALPAASRILAGEHPCTQAPDNTGPSLILALLCKRVSDALFVPIMSGGTLRISAMPCGTLRTRPV